jgi:hypothetical protein
MVSSLDKLTRKLKNNLLDIERSANREGKDAKADNNNNSMFNMAPLKATRSPNHFSN